MKISDTWEMKRFNNSREIAQRHSKVVQMNKWKEFKKKKYVVIEDFTNRRKLMYKVRLILIIVTMQKIQSKIWKNIQLCIAHKELMA